MDSTSSKVCISVYPFLPFRLFLRISTPPSANPSLRSCNNKNARHSALSRHAGHGTPRSRRPIPTVLQPHRRPDLSQSPRQHRQRTRPHPRHKRRLQFPFRLLQTPLSTPLQRVTRRRREARPTRWTVYVSGRELGGLRLQYCARDGAVLRFVCRLVWGCEEYWAR